MSDLKRVYQAVDEQSALVALDDFVAIWDKKIPENLEIMAGKLGKSQHVFQVPGWVQAADLYD